MDPQQVELVFGGGGVAASKFSEAVDAGQDK